MSQCDCAIAGLLTARVSAAKDRRLSAFLRCLTAVLAAGLVLMVTQPALAQQASGAFVYPWSGTLKKTNDTGVVRIGYRENSPPFAFVDGKKPVGYSLDLCEIVLEDIAAELGKDIQPKYLPVTPENRFDLVKSGDVDLECGSTTNNVERRKTAAFSPTM